MSATDKSKLNTIEEGAEVNDVATENTGNEDLSFADDYGNTLVQFKDGHIKTKNFDSSNIIDYIGDVIENEEMDEVLGGEVAVYLTDANGNAVLDDNNEPIEII